MPGDRVHNFFAQDNSTHGQHRSHVGNQSMLNNNFWLGSQRQIDVPNSSSINYSSQNSGIAVPLQCRAQIYFLNCFYFFVGDYIYIYMCIHIYILPFVL